MLKIRQALPYLLLFGIALGLRLWRLEERAFHYDESLHAFYSWRLYVGEGYQHNPMMHGPFKFLSTAFIFHIAGDSDFTARLLPAVIGSLAVVMVYFLRHELGRIGGVATATFLALSPSLLYFSRFARDDIFMVFWALGLLICLIRYHRETKARYLYIAATILALAFTTMESTYILVAIFLSFLFLHTAPELWRKLRARSLANLSPSASFFLLLLGLSLPFYTPGLSLTPGLSFFEDILGFTLANRDPAQGLEGAPLGVGLGVAVGVFALFFFLSWMLGLTWQRRTWLISAGLFYGIYISFYTTFFTNWQGLATGAWGSSSYWLVQHAKERIQQPWFYYPYLLSIYEFLPLVLALVAACYCGRRGGLLTSFLIYWAGVSLILYSYMGEKVPWLIVHLTLPLVLLAGLGVQTLLSRGKGWSKGLLIAFLLVAFPFSLKVAWQANHPGSEPKVEMLVYAQGGAEVLGVREQVTQLLQAGKRLSIDSSLSQPWQWYFRGNPQVDYPNLMTTPPQTDMLILSPQQENYVKSYLGRYGERRDFDQLIWFPESYKGQGRSALAQGWLHYFLFRQAEPYWAWSAVVYLPPL